MKVSVIVPVYNVETYLEKCLESLVHQSLKEIEIILVNDGTKDNSQKIMDQYASQYSNVICLKKENGGLSDARNYGMQYATGEFIAFVDSDDYVDQMMFEKMYRKAVEEDFDIVVCDTIIENENYSYVLKSNQHFTEDCVRAYIYAPPMACTRIVKRNIMENFTFEKGIFYEDLNLTPSYIIRTRKIGFLEEPLYCYVQRPSSIMNQQQFNDKLLDIFKVTENVKNIFKKEGLFEEFHNEIEYLYLIHLLRSATLRFIRYRDTKIYLKKIREKIKYEFPGWKKNPYLKKSNIKFKIVCYLAYYRRYGLLKVLEKFKG